MFVEPAYRQTQDYRLFWEKLGRGEYDAGQYKRIGKGGKEVWIQASYNPIMDLNGKPFKVVKYATDITDQVRASQVLQLTVGETKDAVSAAQANDLSKRIPMQGKDGEIKELCSGVNGLLDTMTTIVSNISEASSTLAAAAREIAVGNTDLSQRTEEQASSLEETSASLEQLTVTVKQNAENAQQANKLASSASDVAVKGGKVVADVVQTMDGITQASRKIAEIIGVIDEIAFQTNILALNAAVEAARAGEQGRGFAVVAAEVRNLAQRSANAAKEIKALISDSVNKVEAGSKLVDGAGKTMEEIVTSVKHVTDIMQQISRGLAGAERRDRAGQFRDRTDGQDHAAERSAGRGGRIGREVDGGPDHEPFGDGGGVPSRHGVRAGQAEARAAPGSCGGIGPCRGREPQPQARTGREPAGKGGRGGGQAGSTAADQWCRRSRLARILSGGETRRRPCLPPACEAQVIGGYRGRARIPAARS